MIVGRRGGWRRPPRCSCDAVSFYWVENRTDQKVRINYSQSDWRRTFVSALTHKVGAILDAGPMQGNMPPASARRASTAASSHSSPYRGPEILRSDAVRPAIVPRAGCPIRLLRKWTEGKKWEMRVERVMSTS
jgi:hypothetical protein